MTRAGRRRRSGDGIGNSGGALGAPLEHQGSVIRAAAPKAGRPSENNNWVAHMSSAARTLRLTAAYLYGSVGWVM